MIRALFWDIDGTLLTTRKAGIVAWEDAVRTVTGVEIKLEDFPTAGLTDFEVGRRMLAHVGGSTDAATVTRAAEAYADALPARLPLRDGRVLPGVTAILDRLAGMPEIHSWLLTGNMRRGAAAKMAHFGLSDYFPSDGAFGDGIYERRDVAAAAWNLAERALPGLLPKEALVIGDTTHDIECGRAIGVRVLAVATGGVPTTVLAEALPWRLYETLPAPDDFLAELQHADRTDA